MGKDDKTRKSLISACPLFLLCLTTGRTLVASGSLARDKWAPSSGHTQAAYARLQLSFEANQGQADDRVRFLAHGPGYTLFLTSNGAVLALTSKRSQGLQSGNRLEPKIYRGSDAIVLRLQMLGANSRVVVSGIDPLSGKSNYFVGNDPERWRTDIPNFAEVKYAGIYRGVNLIYYGRQGQLEYDFVVAPGADPRQVRFRIEGAKRVRLNEAGELMLEIGGREVVLQRPQAYQGNGAGKAAVAVRYVQLGNGTIGFKLGKYRRDRALTIDPVLVYSTYLGGSGGDIAYGIAVDSAGNAYVTGATASVNFPIKSPVQASLAGQGDAFVSKLNPAGTGLIYSTYIGGTGVDVAAAIAIDASGSAYIVGNTSSVDFPVTESAFQHSYAGGTDAFIVKLAPSGSTLDYASYLGGSADDFGRGVAVDSAGNAYVTGSTDSFDFPTVNPLQIGNGACAIVDLVETCSADAFVAKVNAAGTAMVYSTYLGGSGADVGQTIAVDAQGDALIAGYTYSSNFPVQNALQASLGGGSDAFVTELDPTGSNLVFSTYLGGTGNDQALALAQDASGNTYVVGGTESADFPVTPGAFQGAGAYGGNEDAFLSKLPPSGNALLYSTFIGGSGMDQGNGVAVDSAGNTVIVGVTQSTDFPVVDPLQTTLGLSGAGNCASSTTASGVCPDAFITRLDTSGKVSCSTYLGGTEADSAQAVALDSSGTPYVVGSTTSSNFPVIAGALQGAYGGVETSGNAFVAKIDLTDTPGVALTPQEVNFGNQTLNVTSAAQQVTLIDAGSLPLEVTNIEASGDYAVSNNCGTTLSAAGGSCTINITYTPTTAGPSTDEITITDNATDSPQHITVTGNGVNGGAGTLTLTPKSLVFPVQAVGTTSPTQVVQLLNSSNSSITISAITVSGDFTETNNCGAQPSVLNSGASCTVSVTFTPTSSGALTGSLSITDNAAGSPQTVSLSGTGGGLFTLSAASLFSKIVVGTTSTTFTISASAPSSFTSSITLSCSSGATCSFNPASISPGQSSVLTVTGLSATTANPLNFIVTGTSGSNKSTLSLTVFLQDFSLTATPPVDSIDAGQTASYAVTVTGTNGFNGVVLLNCNSQLPNATTCSWSPSSGVTLNGSSTTSATLTVTTTTQQSSRGWPRGHFPYQTGSRRRLWVLTAGLISLFAGLFAGRRWCRFAGRRSFGVLAAAGILLLTIIVIGCQNYGYNVVGTPAVVGTPTGNYTITISGTLGSNSQVVRSTTANLSVGPG